MTHIFCLISPLAKGAYFSDYLKVAKTEIALLTGTDDIQHQTFGAMDFLKLTLTKKIDSTDKILNEIARASVVHGLFIGSENTINPENTLIPMPAAPDFLMHEDFVFGAKYKGKTNELLTQLMINLGLYYLGDIAHNKVKLLDPMCGRGTTLLWAQRYGLQARGIEQDLQALGDFERHVKKMCKLHRQKHQFNRGFMQQAGKQKQGEFAEFATSASNIKIIHGDTQQLPKLTNNEKFHLLITDLPYGIQHGATSRHNKHTVSQNPLDVIGESLAGWYDSLKPQGVAVVAFNSFQPKREQFLDTFNQYNWELVDLNVSHRMSESILRDIVVYKKR